jgi:hypothetical protein
LLRLHEDGFQRIGQFNIVSNMFYYNIDNEAAGEWVFSVYAWVSTLDDGAVLRIGKCEGPLRARLAAYKRSLEDAMGGRLGPDEYFKGDAQPWEVSGWRHYASAPQVGLIFALQVSSSSWQCLPGQALMQAESQLIGAYDPPLCGVSPSGRRAKRNWEAMHGPARAVNKRPQRLTLPGTQVPM